MTDEQLTTIAEGFLKMAELISNPRSIQQLHAAAAAIRNERQSLAVTTDERNDFNSGVQLLDRAKAEFKQLVAEFEREHASN
jgi:hypothetical protein